MKLKLKMVAAAAALASLAGGAHADLTNASAQNNGSFALLAYNTVTFDWYVRDMGYLLNDFLPTGITTSVADNNQGLSTGPNPPAVGNKSPDSGLIIAGSNSVAAAAQTPGGPARPVEIQANFSDPAFATWLGTQNAANVVWQVGSYDLAANATQQSSKRMISSSTRADEDFTNLQVDSFTASGNWGGLFNFFNPATLSNTGTLMNEAAASGYQSDVGQAGVGESAYLFYAVRSAYTGSGYSLATNTPYGTAGGLATVTLEADGDFIYDLPAAAVAAVPLPPALWMMGAGLAAIGGMVRRRSAALQA